MRGQLSQHLDLEKEFERRKEVQPQFIQIEPTSSTRTTANNPADPTMENSSTHMNESQNLNDQLLALEDKWSIMFERNVRRISILNDLISHISELENEFSRLQARLASIQDEIERKEFGAFDCRKELEVLAEKLKSDEVYLSRIQNMINHNISRLFEAECGSVEGANRCEIYTRQYQMLHERLKSMEDIVNDKLKQFENDKVEAIENKHVHDEEKVEDNCFSSPGKFRKIRTENENFKQQLLVSPFTSTPAKSKIPRPVSNPSCERKKSAVKLKFNLPPVRGEEVVIEKTDECQDTSAEDMHHHSECVEHMSEEGSLKEWRIKCSNVEKWLNDKNVYFKHQIVNNLNFESLSSEDQEKIFREFEDQELILSELDEQIDTLRGEGKISVDDSSSFERHLRDIHRSFQDVSFQFELFQRDPTIPELNSRLDRVRRQIYDIINRLSSVCGSDCASEITNGTDFPIFQSDFLHSASSLSPNSLFSLSPLSSFSIDEVQRVCKIIECIRNAVDEDIKFEVESINKLGSRIIDKSKLDDNHSIIDSPNLNHGSSITPQYDEHEKEAANINQSEDKNLSKLSRDLNQLQKEFSTTNQLVNFKLNVYNSVLKISQRLDISLASVNSKIISCEESTDTSNIDVFDKDSKLSNFDDSNCFKRRKKNHLISDIFFRQLKDDVNDVASLYDELLANLTAKNSTGSEASDSCDENDVQTSHFISFTQESIFDLKCKFNNLISQISSKSLCSFDLTDLKFDETHPKAVENCAELVDSNLGKMRLEPIYEEDADLMSNSSSVANTPMIFSNGDLQKTPPKTLPKPSWFRIEQTNGCENTVFFGDSNHTESFKLHDEPKQRKSTEFSVTFDFKSSQNGQRLSFEDSDSPRKALPKSTSVSVNPVRIYSGTLPSPRKVVIQGLEKQQESSAVRKMSDPGVLLHSVSTITDKTVEQDIDMLAQVNSEIESILSDTTNADMLSLNSTKLHEIERNKTSTVEVSPNKIENSAASHYLSPCNSIDIYSCPLPRRRKTFESNGNSSNKTLSTCHSDLNEFSENVDIMMKKLEEVRVDSLTEIERQTDLRLRMDLLDMELNLLDGDVSTLISRGDTLLLMNQHRLDSTLHHTESVSILNTKLTRLKYTWRVTKSDFESAKIRIKRGQGDVQTFRALIQKMSDWMGNVSSNKDIEISNSMFSLKKDELYKLQQSFEKLSNQCLLQEDVKVLWLNLIKNWKNFASLRVENDLAPTIASLRHLKSRLYSLKRKVFGSDSNTIVSEFDEVRTAIDKIKVDCQSDRNAFDEWNSLNVNLKNLITSHSELETMKEVYKTSLNSVERQLVMLEEKIGLARNLAGSGQLASALENHKQVERSVPEQNRQITELAKHGKDLISYTHQTLNASYVSFNNFTPSVGYYDEGSSSSCCTSEIVQNEIDGLLSRWKSILSQMGRQRICLNRQRLLNNVNYLRQWIDEGKVKVKSSYNASSLKDMESTLETLRCFVTSLQSEKRIQLEKLHTDFRKLNSANEITDFVSSPDVPMPSIEVLSNLQKKFDDFNLEVDSKIVQIEINLTKLKDISSNIARVEAFLAEKRDLLTPSHGGDVNLQAILENVSLELKSFDRNVVEWLFEKYQSLLESVNSKDMSISPEMEEKMSKLHHEWYAFISDVKKAHQKVSHKELKCDNKEKMCNFESDEIFEEHNTWVQQKREMLAELSPGSCVDSMRKQLDDVEQLRQQMTERIADIRVDIRKCGKIELREHLMCEWSKLEGEVCEWHQLVSEAFNKMVNFESQAKALSFSLKQVETCLGTMTNNRNTNETLPISSRDRSGLAGVSPTKKEALFLPVEKIATSKPKCEPEMLVKNGQESEVDQIVRLRSQLSDLDGDLRSLQEQASRILPSLSPSASIQLGKFASRLETLKCELTARHHSLVTPPDASHNSNPYSDPNDRSGGRQCRRGQTGHAAGGNGESRSSQDRPLQLLNSEKLSKLPPGWERQFTAVAVTGGEGDEEREMVSVPFYLNHQSQESTWNHPRYSEMIRRLQVDQCISDESQLQSRTDNKSSQKVKERHVICNVFHLSSRMRTVQRFLSLDMITVECLISELQKMCFSVSPNSKSLVECVEILRRCFERRGGVSDGKKKVGGSSPLRVSKNEKGHKSSTRSTDKSPTKSSPLKTADSHFKVEDKIEIFLNFYMDVFFPSRRHLVSNSTSQNHHHQFFTSIIALSSASLSQKYTAIFNMFSSLSKDRLSNSPPAREKSRRNIPDHALHEIVTCLTTLCPVYLNRVLADQSLSVAKMVDQTVSLFYRYKQFNANSIHCGASVTGNKRLTTTSFLGKISRHFSAKKEGGSTGTVEKTLIHDPTAHLQDILGWITQNEPHHLSWLSTFHRICSAETAIHRSSRCRGCEVKPIRGFRYHCTRCYKVDLCQDCFMSSGESIRRVHKPSHPVIEYCTSTGVGDDLKHLGQSIRHSFRLTTASSARRRRKSKPMDGGESTRNPPASSCRKFGGNVTQFYGETASLVNVNNNDNTMKGDIEQRLRSSSLANSSQVSSKSPKKDYEQQKSTKSNLLEVEDSSTLLNQTSVSLILNTPKGNKSSFSFNNPNEDDYGIKSYDSGHCGGIEENKVNNKVESPMKFALQPMIINEDDSKGAYNYLIKSTTMDTMNIDSFDTDISLMSKLCSDFKSPTNEDFSAVEMFAKSRQETSVDGKSNKDSIPSDFLEDKKSSKNPIKVASSTYEYNKASSCSEEDEGALDCACVTINTGESISETKGFNTSSNSPSVSSNADSNTSSRNRLGGPIINPLVNNSSPMHTMPILSSDNLLRRGSSKQHGTTPDESCSLTNTKNLNMEFDGVLDDQDIRNVKLSGEHELTENNEKLLNIQIHTLLNSVNI